MNKGIISVVFMPILALFACIVLLIQSMKAINIALKSKQQKIFLKQISKLKEQ
jgi:hypothetical protein